jgi:LmbE family N-acetylglucosaminyl deacetylase
MVRHMEDGDSVFVVIMAQGITSRKEKDGKYDKELSELRGDAKRALAKLGVMDVEFLDFPDNAMDSVPLLEIVKRLEKIIKDKKPEVVYTHHWGDLNIDHRTTFNAVMTACRPGTPAVRKIMCFEVASSTEWNVQNTANVFLPNIFLDITDSVDKKIAALLEYRGEMRPYPHPRSIEGVRIMAKMRGLVIGKKAAEAFELVREIV